MIHILPKHLASTISLTSIWCQGWDQARKLLEIWVESIFSGLFLQSVLTGSTCADDIRGYPRGDNIFLPSLLLFHLSTYPLFLPLSPHHLNPTHLNQPCVTIRLQHHCRDRLKSVDTSSNSPLRTRRLWLSVPHTHIFPLLRMTLGSPGLWKEARLSPIYPSVLEPKTHHPRQSPVSFLVIFSHSVLFDSELNLYLCS